MEVSEIDLRPGDEYPVVLGSLGSAGYTWEFSVEGPPGVVFVRPVPPEPPSVDPLAPLHTFSTDLGFVIEALRQGTSEVRFMLRRPWEKGKPALRTLVYRVSVR